MVNGFESFREHFRGYEDCYTIIGGAACDILMGEAALNFRATRDIDMILLIESRFKEFAGIFWDYIKAGKYRCGWRSSEKPHFYRFTEPESAGFPTMIELFSRRPDFLAEREGVIIGPLRVSDEISSLSAIILDGEYYKLMLEGRRTVDGISVLGAEYLILFKAKAWLDLSMKKAAGAHVNDRDLKKHKNDVFRLYTIIEPGKRISLSETVAGDVAAFIEAMPGEGADLNNLGITELTLAEALEGIRKIFLPLTPP